VIFIKPTPITSASQQQQTSNNRNVSMPEKTAKTQSLPKASRMAKAPARPAEVKIPPVAWDRNPEWTEAMIEVWTSDATIREGLFHDSKKKKGNSGKSKKHWWTILYEEVFTDLLENPDDPAIRSHYIESIGNRLNT
jgi:hypothetical protein